jgi:hypothetical protein
MQILSMQNFFEEKIKTARKKMRMMMTRDKKRKIALVNNNKFNVKFNSSKVVIMKVLHLSRSCALWMENGKAFQGGTMCAAFDMEATTPAVFPFCKCTLAMLFNVRAMKGLFAQILRL